MQLPGIPGPAEDPVLREKVEEDAERLLEELKKEVRAEIKDVGTLRKELHVTVPAKIIADHLDHNYAELMHDAIVPGFRKGRAPRRLIEKRYGSEVRESLTTSIIGQSFFAATENNKLDVLGDPLFRIKTGEEVKLIDIDEALQHLKLPASGDFDYVCEIEIKPTFELPELKGIEVEIPQIAITDEMVAEELLRQRKIRGRYEPQPEGSAERDDILIADVTLTVGDQPVKTEENVQFGVRPAALDGITLPKLAEALTGAKVGETRAVDCTVPDDYERADLRGQPGRFEFKIHDLKRLAPLALEEFLQRSGFETENEARDYYRILLENDRDGMIGQAKKGQISEYLLRNTSLDLPEKLSARQTDRAVLRRMVELRQRGVPDGDLQASIDELRSSAREEVTRDLKLGFILGKVADELELEVTDEEINTEIAQMARRYNRRFDRIRDDLQKEGLLSQLAEQIRHDKCVAKLLADAKLVEARAPHAADKKGEPPAAPKAPKKRKKATRKKAASQGTDEGAA